MPTVSRETPTNPPADPLDGPVSPFRLSDASPVSDLLALLRERCILPPSASQRIAVPLPGLVVHLIRSRSRERVRADADSLLALVDPLQGGGPGSCHVRGPRRDGHGGYYAICIVERFDPTP